MAEFMYIKFLNRLSRQRVLLHILFWLAVTGFCYLVFHYYNNPWRILATNLGFLPGHILFAYSLNYFLFPRYVLKGKWIASIIGFILILYASLFYLRWADSTLIHYSTHAGLWIITYPRSIYALFSTGWMAVSIKLVKSWYQEKEKQQQLEKEKLKVELQLLKSQLHPHFLFNTLNSLYSFSLQKSDETPQIVLQLSSLLRYILYECNAPLIPLSTEINIIEQYLQLESRRFGDRLESSQQFTGDIKGRNIAPLILLPFVENSIKHGISEQLEKSWISLHLYVEADTLHFKLINSRDEQQPTAHTGGLGLQNVQKRLELLYPDSHTLKYTTDDDTWQVSLAIKLTPTKTQAHKELHPNHAYETQMLYR